MNPFYRVCLKEKQLNNIDANSSLFLGLAHLFFSSLINSPPSCLVIDVYSDHNGFKSVRSSLCSGTLPDELRCRNCNKSPTTLSLCSPVSSQAAAISLGQSLTRGRVKRGEEGGDRGGDKSGEVLLRRMRSRA